MKASDDRAKRQIPDSGLKSLWPRFGGVWGLLWVLILALWFWGGQAMTGMDAVKTIAYSEFRQRLAERRVTDVVISESEIQGIVTAVAQPVGAPQPAEESTPWYTALIPSRPKAPEQGIPGLERFRAVRVDDPKLVEDLAAAGVTFSGVKPSPFIHLLGAVLLPFLLMLWFWGFWSRRISSVGTTFASIGKSRARLVVDRDTGVSFSDVAGCEEAKRDLEEVVDFLRSPERYKSLGAKIPKGVLLVGLPGTGKTLLARALAGEAKVPFYSIAGSDFVEMFVGVGAARVRDLFSEAKKEGGACIIFIDEIDAIGRHRSVNVNVANDEREQTLNQLLSEMDGFEPTSGVIVLAATNRPEVLDRALLRPGRFDRQVVIDAPDLAGRIAILKVHAKGKPLATDVSLEKIARSTPGFCGADLANALNEAALLATRRSHEVISQKDLEEAVEKVVAGPERKSHRLGDEERRRVAFHEAGHAVVAASLKDADPVHKISIVPRGRAALGYTWQVPATEQFILSKSALLDRLRSLMGGRAAEEVMFHDMTTGAANDLEKATAIAEQMVCVFGMSEGVGLVHYAHQRPLFLPAIEGDALPRSVSPETATLIDHEVRQILDQAYQDALEILLAKRPKLEAIAEALVARETLDGEELEGMLRPLKADRPS